ncbi:PKHA6 protein, partial [Atractosteus spatula]|nr:PKHA6 protein [Atractosteus spatula]
MAHSGELAQVSVFSHHHLCSLYSHNDRNGALGHPVIQNSSEETRRLQRLQYSNPDMSGKAVGKRPVSIASDVNSTHAMVSDVSPEQLPNGRASRSSKKAVTFGKRSNSMRRNPKAEVTQQGWLYKQASNGVKQWNKRWFVLTDRCLFYYKDEKEEGVLGSIPLLSFRICGVQPSDNISRRHAFKTSIPPPIPHCSSTSSLKLLASPDLSLTAEEQFQLACWEEEEEGRCSNRSSSFCLQVEHAGIRTYYFSAESREDQEAWVRAMNEAACVHITPTERYTCSAWGQTGRFTPKASSPKNNSENIPPAGENNAMVAKGVEPYQRGEGDGRGAESRDPSKREVNGVVAAETVTPTTPLTPDLDGRGRGEKRAAQPNGWGNYRKPDSSAFHPQEPREPPENNVMRRGFVPRTQPERLAQRKSSMSQLQQWVNLRRGLSAQEELRSPARYYQTSRGMPADYYGMYGPQYIEEYGLYPPGVRPDSICSVTAGFERVPPRWATEEKRRSLRDGPLHARERPREAAGTGGFQWVPAAAAPPMRRLSMQPRSRSVPRSPPSSQGPYPPGSRAFSPVRSPSARFDRGAPGRHREDVIYADPSAYGLRRSISSPKYEYPRDRRSLTQGMYHYNYPGSPTLHDKMDDILDLQLQRNLEYLDQQVTESDHLISMVHRMVENSSPRAKLYSQQASPFHDIYRELHPSYKTSEVEVDKLLGRLCEQNRVLKDQEAAVQRLRIEKDGLEGVLVATHQELDLYRSQPSIAENLRLKKESLQNQLINIRGELSQATSVLSTTRMEFEALEDEVNAIHSDLWEQLNTGGQNEHVHRYLQKEFWRIQDVLEGLYKNNPSRGTDTAKYRDKQMPFSGVNYNILQSLHCASVYLYIFTPFTAYNLHTSSCHYSCVNRTCCCAQFIPRDLESVLGSRQCCNDLLLSFSPPATSAASGSFSTNSPASPLSSVSLTSPLSPFSPVSGSQGSPTKQMGTESSQPCPDPSTLIPQHRIRGLGGSVFQRIQLETLLSRLAKSPATFWNRVCNIWELDSVAQCPCFLRMCPFTHTVHKFSYMSHMPTGEKPNGSEQQEAEHERQSSQNKVGVVPPRTKSPARDETNSSDPMTRSKASGKQPNGHISRERPKSAVFQAEVKSKMSVEEQNERIRRNQSSSMREKRRSLQLSSGQQIDGLKPTVSYRVVRRRLTAHEVDIKDLEAAVRGEGVESPREEIARLRRLQVEPEHYDLDIGKELLMPDKVLIPERYLDAEPEVMLSPEEIQEKQKKVERIKTLIAKSNMQNIVPLLDGPADGQADPEQQRQEQEKRIEISCALAAEASRRSRLLSELGVGLTAFGLFFLMFGVLLYFDSVLLAFGNILFLAGLAVIIGLRRTFQFFFQRHKLRGSAFFLGGVALVLLRWPVVGMVMETYGFVLLFRIRDTNTVNNRRALGTPAEGAQDLSVTVTFAPFISPGHWEESMMLLLTMMLMMSVQLVEPWAGHPQVSSASPTGQYYVTSPEMVFGIDGGSVDVECQYASSMRNYVKVWCREEFGGTCTDRVTADKITNYHGMSIKDDKPNNKFIVTLSQLKERDSGRYHCKFCTSTEEPSRFSRYASLNLKGTAEDELEQAHDYVNVSEDGWIDPSDYVNVPNSNELGACGAPRKAEEDYDNCVTTLYQNIHTFLERHAVDSLEVLNPDFADATCFHACIDMEL